MAQRHWSRWVLPDPVVADSRIWIWLLKYWGRLVASGIGFHPSTTSSGAVAGVAGWLGGGGDGGELAGLG
jgi:hypothetical protein